MEPFRFFDITLSEVPFDTRELYLLMGYGEHLPSDEVLTVIDDVFCELSNCCKPHFGYIILDGEIIDKERILVRKDVVLTPSRIITSALRESQQFALFTATTGTNYDSWLKQIEKEKDIVKTYIANTIGSVIVESTVSLLMQKLESAANNEGLSVSNRYSPGYCDWMLMEQKQLLSLFPQNTTGIQLTDSCLMLPIKSVSGIVGIGANVKKRSYGCDICKMTNCIKNKKKQTSRDC
jgi:hypothetical protein